MKVLVVATAAIAAAYIYNFPGGPKNFLEQTKSWINQKLSSL